MQIQQQVPRVSIIMTTWNSIAHIEETLESVLSQDYPDLEIVIADGGSTDGTVDVIRRYAERVNCAAAGNFRRDQDSKTPSAGVQRAPSGNLLSDGTGDKRSRKILWKSEPDQGIYDGMNKAIRMSAGEIIAVCNDLFTRTDAVSLMVKAIGDAEARLQAEAGNPGKAEPSGAEEKMKGSRSQPSRTSIIGAHADLAYMDGDKVVRKWVMGQGRIEDGWLPAHPTMYLKREVYERYGLYDLRYKSSSDYEFMVRVLKHPENQLAYVPVELIHMFYGGTSNAGVKGYLRNTREAYDALKANEVPHPARVIARRILRTLRQFR